MQKQNNCQHTAAEPWWPLLNACFQAADDSKAAQRAQAAVEQRWSRQGSRPGLLLDPDQQWDRTGQKAERRRAAFLLTSSTKRVPRPDGLAGNGALLSGLKRDLRSTRPLETAAEGFSVAAHTHTHTHQLRQIRRW